MICSTGPPQFEIFGEITEENNFPAELTASSITLAHTLT